MLIGKAGPAVSAICTSDPKHIEIRGKDLATEIMGHYGFTDFFFFLVTGKKPTGSGGTCRCCWRSPRTRRSGAARRPG